MPILFSGGITNFAIARQLYEQTGVDGFLVGRGLIGKPWLLQQLHEESQGRQFVAATNEIHQAIIMHLDYSIEWAGARGFSFFKKHLAEYLKSMGFDRRARRELLLSSCHEKMREQLKNFLNA